MWNPTSTGTNTLVNTATALTLGFGPGQTAPPEMLIQNLSAGGTVTLPKINSVPPTAPGTPGTTAGIGDGVPLFIKNIAQQITTITPASGDTCDISLLSNINDCSLLITDAANSKWRSVQQLSGANNAITTAAGATTLSPTTRYLIMSAAAAVTVPATVIATSSQYTVVNESSGSVTVTPASGTINTTAAFTITTLASMTFFSDGTNLHCAATK